MRIKCLLNFHKWTEWKLEKTNALKKESAHTVKRRIQRNINTISGVTMVLIMPVKYAEKRKNITIYQLTEFLIN